MSGRRERNPFVGARPIEAKESLFGRDAEVDVLYHLLLARRIVVLHAPSGAGKSSLVNAGLIPKLKDGNFDPWTPIRIHSDPQAFGGIPKETNRYLLSALVSLEEEVMPKEHRRSPAQLAGLDFLEYLKSRPRRKGRKEMPVVLLFDQFEEMLTIEPRAVDEKRAFFDAVGKALDTGGYWALFVVREDYLAAFAPYRERIPTQMSNTFRLDLLNRVSAKEAAEKLALEGGRTFSAVDQLVQNISMVQVQQADGTFVAEQGRYVEPVLLQVVCQRLWDAMPEDDLSIDPEDIGKYADVSKALGAYYANAVKLAAGGTIAVERAVREWVGTKLIIGGIRSQVRLSSEQSAGLDNKLIIALANSYLVRKDERAGVTWFELTHDRLVEAVLLDNAAWEKETLHPLQVQAKLWAEGGEGVSFLASAEALSEFAPWVETNAALMTEGEKEFWRKSQERRQQERRALNQKWGFVALVVVFLVVALGLEAWGLRSKEEASSASADKVKEEDKRKNAESDANKQRDAALRSSILDGSRESLANGQRVVAALLLASVKDPDKARGWSRLATDLLSSGIPRSTFRHPKRVDSASWSPNDERILTVSSDKMVRVWNADGSGSPLVLSGHTGVINSAAWSPDGTQILTASSDGSARVWNADGSGTPLVFIRHEELVRSASWSPNGKRIATASSDRTVRVWNADGSGPLTVFKEHNSVVWCAAWSPDSKRLATASSDRTVRVWNADGSGKSVVLSGHEGIVDSAFWSRDGLRILTVSSDRTARVWNADGSGKAVVLGTAENPVISASWSPDGRYIVTTSNDSAVRVWDSHESGDPRVLERHNSVVHSASWSPDGRHIVTASSDRTAHVWDTEDWGTSIMLKGHEAGVNSASWSADGKRIVTTSVDRTARVWRVDGSGTPRTLRGHRRAVVSASWSADGTHIVTASYDNTARVWNADGSGTPLVLRAHTSAINSARWSLDSSRIVTASFDATARIWNADGSGTPLVVKGHDEDGVNHASFSFDGKFVATAGDDKTARVWNVDGSSNGVVLKGHEGAVNCVSFSPDGKRIVTASDDKTARVWNADGSGTLRVLSGHDEAVRSASFSPDGTRIVTASVDMTARVWNADGSGKPIVLTGHEDAVNSAAFSLDGARIVTASSDMTARVWNADGSGTHLVLKCLDDVVNDASFSPDGMFVVTASDDNTASIWPSTIAGLQKALRDATTDCLTPGQRQTYLLEPENVAASAFKECEIKNKRPVAP